MWTRRNFSEGIPAEEPPPNRFFVYCMGVLATLTISEPMYPRLYPLMSEIMTRNENVSLCCFAEYGLEKHQKQSYHYLDGVLGVKKRGKKEVGPEGFEPPDNRL